MKKTELKAIEHVLQLLSNIDTYQVYSALSKKLKEFSVGDDEQNDILSELQNNTQIVNKQIKECRNWLDAIVEDLKKE